MFNKRKLISSILIKLTKAFVAIVVVIVVIYFLSARMERISVSLADKQESAFDVANRNATAVKLREDFKAIDNKDRSIENALVPIENTLDFVSEIEKIAAETPEKILKAVVDPGVGLQHFQARRLCFGLGLTGDAFKNGVKFLMALHKAYEATDASLAEINPLVITREGSVLALDAKMSFDDNALYRHPDIVEMRDLDEEDRLEVEASKSNLNYIKLDGNVGCMVNGAGLAMATMDIIKLAGGMPANFLDVGGGASAQTVEAGFRIILKDPNVRAVLINIFGGIVRCDRVATGVVEAAKNVDVRIPIVIRLAGTNADLAAEILKTSGLRFLVAESLKEAAEKVTQAIAA